MTLDAKLKYKYIVELLAIYGPPSIIGVSLLYNDATPFWFGTNAIATIFNVNGFYVFGTNYRIISLIFVIL